MGVPNSSGGVSGEGASFLGVLTREPAVIWNTAFSDPEKTYSVR